MFKNITIPEKGLLTHNIAMIVFKKKSMNRFFEDCFKNILHIKIRG